MPKEDKKLAAILAEMRGNEFDDPHLDADGIIGARRLARDFADRIEAAARRERAEIEAKVGEMIAFVKREMAKPAAPSNTAALREALEQALAYCESDQKSGIAYSDNDVLVPMLRAALAAPGRNCDRFATADDARRAFESAHSHGIVHNLYTAAFDWLFARAEGVKE